MKKLTRMLAIVALGLLTACGGGDTADTTPEGDGGDTPEETATETTYTVDTEASTMNWTGSMLKFYDHEGTLKISEGSFTVSNGAVTGGSFTVDMTSMSPTDENFNPDEGKTPEALVGHLMSADFFDVENNPTATFTINDAASAESIAGDLTVRGTTNKAKVTDIMVKEADGTATVAGNLTFNRQDFGVAYDAGADMVISDDIVVAIKMVGK